jgi:hypothetical protein
MDSSLFASGILRHFDCNDRWERGFPFKCYADDKCYFQLDAVRVAFEHVCRFHVSQLWAAFIATVGVILIGVCIRYVAPIGPPAVRTPRLKFGCGLDWLLACSNSVQSCSHTAVPACDVHTMQSCRERAASSRRRE